MAKHAAGPQAGDPSGFQPWMLVHPAVLIEFMIGIGPLAGIAWWNWDTFLVLMQHFLALAVSAAWLVARFATLSQKAFRYFGQTPIDSSRPRARWLYTGFALFTLGLPIFLLVAFITVELRAPSAPPIRSLGDFWRVVVVSPGLWLPLALVAG